MPEGAAMIKRLACLSLTSLGLSLIACEQGNLTPEERRALSAPAADVRPDRARSRLPERGASPADSRRLQAAEDLAVVVMVDAGTPRDQGGAEVRDAMRDAARDAVVDGAADDAVALDSGIVQSPSVIEDPAHQSDTAAQLAALYAAYGGRDAFPALHRGALEALLSAEDALAAGALVAADEEIESVFAMLPRGDPRWSLGASAGTGGSNIGHPAAYYGLRMLEQVVALGQPAGAGTLQMTGVVARCAVARRARVPDLQPEVVNVELHPEILNDQARRLFLATQLFRRWMQAITGGVRLALRIFIMEGCSEVDFTDDGATLISYPDAQAMVDAVDPALARETDIWWVVTPSGIVGEEEELGRHFITGGMGLTRDGRPLILSDDLWFIRKPNHMGRGEWTEAEVRSYHPQWFQHEFMHHLFRAWPGFRLEVEGHQWFDRATWPADFEGLHEADYYAEAITRRFLNAEPRLAEGLQAPEFSPAGAFELEEYLGRYRREPVENPWHEVTIELSDQSLRWRNQADVSWSLQLEGDQLRAGADCPYGAQALRIETRGGELEALWFNGEPYRRVD